MNALINTELGESSTGKELYNIVMNSVLKGREEDLKKKFDWHLYR